MSDEQTPSAFLENAPLFSRVKFKGGFSQPGSISLDCSTCGKENDMGGGGYTVWSVGHQHFSIYLLVVQD